MKSISTILFFLVTTLIYAQDKRLPLEDAVTTEHTSTINGQRVPYTATTGLLPLYNVKGKPTASIHYTYYKRSDVKDMATRPIMFSFNGGPGSASVWMHIAYTGPKVLKIDDEGHPIQPYGVKDNPYSVLDVADIVFVNPVNTGYSRPVEDKDGKVDKSKFFGVNADASYLAEWMRVFVTRNNLWQSPKYIIGESYGGTRVMALAGALQDQEWMYLNGVIMVSPADYKVKRHETTIYDMTNVPYYTATAWHHKALPTELQSMDLEEVLALSEKFALDEVLPAFAKGGLLSMSDKEAIAEKLAYYTGLSKTDFMEHNLRVPSSYFWKELLRDEEGKTVGRLDSRYKGVDKMEAGQRPEQNQELTSWLHSFTPAINYYMREHLNYKTDVRYNMFGPVSPWSFENDNARERMTQAMLKNPYLKLLVQSGYYDGGTTYFNAKYTMWQINQNGKLTDRMYFKGYRSGHMMYLRAEDLKKSNDDLREFIKNSETHGESAKY